MRHSVRVVSAGYTARKLESPAMRRAPCSGRPDRWRSPASAVGHVASSVERRGERPVRSRWPRAVR